MMDDVIGKQMWYVGPVWDSDDTGRAPLWIIIKQEKNGRRDKRPRPSVTIDDLPLPPQSHPLPQRPPERGIANIDYTVRGAYL